MKKHVEVSVGVVYSPEGDKILLSKRTEKQCLPGLWEFPGGKVEEGEDIRAALDRELYEETGIRVKKVSKLTEIHHEYPEGTILLHVWSVNEWLAQVVARENQEIAWVAISELNRYILPEASRRVIPLISLPRFYLISKPFCDDKAELLSVLDSCFSVGLKLFQLRLKSQRGRFLTDLISEIKQTAKNYGAQWILNGTPESLEHYDADGLHLNAEGAVKYTDRPVAKEKMLGVSCHNEHEMAQAERIGADYIFLSPVKMTKSFPEKNPLGWDQFSRLCQKTNLPVLHWAVYQAQTTRTRSQTVPTG